MTASPDPQDPVPTPDARVALAEPLPAMVYRSEAFAEDLEPGTPPSHPLSGALRAGLARVWAAVPLGVALAAGVGLPWTLPH